MSDLVFLIRFLYFYIFYICVIFARGFGRVRIDHCGKCSLCFVSQLKLSLQGILLKSVEWFRRQDKHTLHLFLVSIL